jgi:hypothetical protein
MSWNDWPHVRGTGGQVPWNTHDWFDEHVGEPDPGGVYTCEPRMAQDILQAAARDLLSWQ